MTKNARLLCIAGAILMAVAGVALASNMGFKHVHGLPLADPNIFDISFPLNNSLFPNDTFDLVRVFDSVIGACCPGGVQVQCVQGGPSPCCDAAATIFKEDQTSSTWTGPGGFTSVAIPEGASVRVSVKLGDPNNPIGGCSTWEIAGTHDPNFGITFPLSDPNFFFVSVPYHTTSLTIGGLCYEIDPDCNNGTGTSVTVFTPDQGSVTWNIAFPGADNPSLSIGLGVKVTVHVAGTIWVPTHY